MTDFPRMVGLSYYIIDTEMYKISHKQIFFQSVLITFPVWIFFLLFFVSSIIYLILINKENLTGKQGMGYALHVLNNEHKKIDVNARIIMRQDMYVWFHSGGFPYPNPPPLSRVSADYFNGLL